jgi:hypothetical protein
MNLTRNSFLSILCFGIAVLVFGSCRASASSPYPPSPVISGITWDFSSLSTAARGSDIWAATWADDDNLYAVWGDGGGFDGTNSDGRVSLGVARIEGPPDSWIGSNVFGGKNPEAPATFPGKANSIIAIDGGLYMVVSEQGAWKRGKIGRSQDHGRTWTFNKGSFDRSDWDFSEPAGAFAGAVFLQFGRDYSGSRDEYVYVYSERERNDSNTELLLARVRKTEVPNRDAYEFFAGRDSSGMPRWSEMLTDAEAVFKDPAGVNWGFSAVYNPHIGRYLLTTRRHKKANGRLGAWSIFDSPEPWGPWTTVAYYNDWDKETPFEGVARQILYNFPPKWISDDGLNVWMIVSMNDSFNLLKGVFALHDSTSESNSPPAPSAAGAQ